jgi:hypothetical protein
MDDPGLDSLALLSMTDGKLIHLVFAGDEVTLCGRLRVEQLTAVVEGAPGLPPACPECAERAQVAGPAT